MPYTYDTDRAPLWADSVRGELVADPVAYAETQPGRLTEAELDAAIASKSPRIPRHRPITGTSNQGRVIHRAGDAQRHTEPLVSRLSPIDAPREYGRLWWGVMTIISVVAVAFALAGCGGGDASASEVAEHDQQTIQPVSCAASGCAR